MSLEFKSQKELYERVKPALRARIARFKRLGYKNIKEYDIWEYLVESKWKNSKNLMLSDIINDILNVEYIMVYSFKMNIGNN